MKTISLIFILLMAVSCGDKGSGGGSGSKPSPSTPHSSPQVSDCSIQILKTDGLAEIALKANQMRIECELSEDEIVQSLIKD